MYVIAESSAPTNYRKDTPMKLIQHKDGTYSITGLTSTALKVRHQRNGSRKLNDFVPNGTAFINCDRESAKTMPDGSIEFDFTNIVLRPDHAIVQQSYRPGSIFLSPRKKTDTGETADTEPSSDILDLPSAEEDPGTV